MESKIVAIYDYRTKNGELLYQNIRFEPKDFRPRRSDGNGDYIWDLKGVTRTLYRLSELLKASKQDFVFITEGEKDANRLSELGLAATTSGSATSWKPEFAEHFTGRLVCITPDNNLAGRRYTEAVTKSLYGIAAEIRVLELHLPEGGDVSNWLDSGGTKEQLLELLDETEPFEPDTSGVKLNFISLSSIEPEAIEWFWPNKIPTGAVTIFAGDPGTGKSYLTHYIASQVTRGAIWPDCPDEPTIKGSVIFIADEDDRAKVIRPRLDKHGADVSKVFILDKVFTGDEREFFDLSKHLEGLDRTLKKISDCRLLIFDPITAYLGKTNANSNAEVRAVLTPLAALAVRHNITVIGINHLNKRADLSYMYRGLGSQAFVAQSRSAWAVMLDQDDRETRIFAPIKSNYCIEPTGLKFRIIDGVVFFEPDPWTGHVDDSGRDKKSRLNEAADWLTDRLKDGAVLSSTVLDEGKEQGFSKNLLYRAKEKAGIRASKDGFGGQWFWSLQNSED